MWYRVIVDGDTLLQSKNVQISQSLEGAGPILASIDVAGPIDFELARGQSIVVYQVDVGHPTEDDTYVMRPFFTGEIDEISATSFEHNVRLSCTSAFNRLDRVQIADVEYASPKTDIQMAKDIFDYCDIPYSSSYIDGPGYNLSLLEPLVWRK